MQKSQLRAVRFLVPPLLLAFLCPALLSAAPMTLDSICPFATESVSPPGYPPGIDFPIAGLGDDADEIIRLLAEEQASMGELSQMLDDMNNPGMGGLPCGAGDSLDDLVSGIDNLSSGADLPPSAWWKWTKRAGTGVTSFGIGWAADYFADDYITEATGIPELGLGAGTMAGGAASACFDTVFMGAQFTEAFVAETGVGALAAFDLWLILKAKELEREEWENFKKNGGITRQFMQEHAANKKQVEQALRDHMGMPCNRELTWYQYLIHQGFVPNPGAFGGEGWDTGDKPWEISNPIELIPPSPRQ